MSDFRKRIKDEYSELQRRVLDRPVRDRPTFRDLIGQEMGEFIDEGSGEADLAEERFKALVVRLQTAADMARFNEWYECVNDITSFFSGVLYLPEVQSHSPTMTVSDLLSPSVDPATRQKRGEMVFWLSSEIRRRQQESADTVRPSLPTIAGTGLPTGGTRSFMTYQLDCDLLANKTASTRARYDRLVHQLDGIGQC